MVKSFILVSVIDEPIAMIDMSASVMTTFISSHLKYGPAQMPIQ